MNGFGAEITLPGLTMVICAVAMPFAGLGNKLAGTVTARLGPEGAEVNVVPRGVPFQYTLDSGKIFGPSQIVPSVNVIVRGWPIPPMTLAGVREPIVGCLTIARGYP